jgi:prolyl-tRNA synthetase
VAEFTGLPETSQIKSLVMVADGKPYLCLLRGDHALSETKFASITGASTEPRPAHPDEIREWFGADPGSLGPVGVTSLRVLTDVALRGRRNMICGANRNDYHLRNVTPGKDFQAEFHDLRQVAEGDTEINTGAPLRIIKTVEVGHIFKLGYKYSEAMGLRVLDEAGKEVTPIMGSYGIGVGRILCAAIELYADRDGMVLPPSIAPFTVVVTPVNYKDEALRQAADGVHAQCQAAGLDVLIDDRDERPGVKFKDADLIGIPYRITVGRKLAKGLVEVVDRKARQATDVPLEGAARWVAEKIHEH